MSVLVISSFPPMACGIGTYAAQEVKALRAAGKTVDVYSPPEGGGDFHGSFLGARALLWMARWLWAYEEIHIHFTPHFFFRSDSALGRLGTSLAFYILAFLFGKKLHFLIHETEYKVDNPLKNRSWRRRIDRRMWRRCASVTFHSVREREAFKHYYYLPPDSPNLKVEAHDRNFIRFFAGSREDARSRIGVTDDQLLLLCIGFIQPHKGFERVIEAMRHVNSPKVVLRIVGSVRIAWEPALEYATLLHELVKADLRCGFVETYINDEEFDMWICAADYVVAPYHEIWSSSVVARAKLFGTPVIAADTGGLKEQLTPGSYVFHNDAELAEILNKVAPDMRTTVDQVLLADHPAFRRGHGWSQPAGRDDRSSTVHLWTVGDHQTVDWTGPARPGDYLLRIFLWRPHPFPEAEISIQYLLSVSAEWKSARLPLDGSSIEERIVTREPFERLRVEFKTPTWIPAERIPGSDDPRPLGVMLTRIEVLHLHDANPDRPDTGEATNAEADGIPVQ